MGKRTYEPPSEPWERQLGEGQQAFKAFCAYRDLGVGGAKRSLQKTIQKHPKSDGTPYSLNTLKMWSKKWNWKERTDAWDDEQDRQVRDELTKGVTAMRKKHADIAQAMLVKALKALQKIPEDDLSMADITRIVDAAAKLERISRGEATERTEGKQTIAGEVSVSAIDLSGISDGELAQLDELTRKILPGQPTEP